MQETFISVKAPGIHQVLVKTHTCVISLGLKRPCWEPDHSCPSTDMVKNVWSYIYIPSHASMLCIGTTVLLELYICFSLHVDIKAMTNFKSSYH
jgi:hypothetical protein